MDRLRERAALKKILVGFPRSPKQENDLFEADMEILKLAPRHWLLSSTDSIADEISDGLYKDPFLWGWMAVMASVSDLAASGAEGLGLLLSSQWGSGLSSVQRLRAEAGMKAALKKAQLPLLGGDSGRSTSTVLTSTVLGQKKGSPPLTRLGAKPGDLLVLLEAPRLGLGPALALRFLEQAPERLLPEARFRPAPSWKSTQQLRPWIRCSIDTSDGLAVSLAILSELNGVGFDLELRAKDFHPLAIRCLHQLQIPWPLLITTDHGDYQSLLVVRPKHLKHVLKTPGAKKIGRVVEKKQGVRLFIPGNQRPLLLPVDRVSTSGKSLNEIRHLKSRLARVFRSMPT